MSAQEDTAVVRFPSEPSLWVWREFPDVGFEEVRAEDDLLEGGAVVGWGDGPSGGGGGAWGLGEAGDGD
jgi:hypothetical protein